MHVGLRRSFGEIILIMLGVRFGRPENEAMGHMSPNSQVNPLKAVILDQFSGSSILFWAIGVWDSLYFM